MNNYEQVDQLIADLKAQGTDKQLICWQAAKACVGWPYVYGARGELCTPANRRSRYSADHPTIKTACRNFEGDASCTGCKWYPGSKRVRCFDCRGFTYKILLAVYDWKLNGAGANSQWNDDKNWSAKGEIATMPMNKLCCLFRYSDGRMQHTGFGLNNETVECSSGVQFFSSRNAKWTHWAVPVVVEGTVRPTPEPEPVTEKLPTIKKGNKGKYVTMAQQMLLERGYSLGICGVDGDFGTATDKAVRLFQKDWGLEVDGIIGPKTWGMLQTTQPKELPVKERLFTVTVTGLKEEDAKTLAAKYPHSSVKEE